MFGAQPPGGDYSSWEPWPVSIDEAIDRITHGYNGVPGYLQIDDDAIGSNEAFRADLIVVGEQRLRELGNPYESYGDPWRGTPRETCR
ncbi:hypothetical protein FMUAM8_06720 [Nocardia cyriacigeorgica]|nr:hypothetical protein FMUAM8_06720 [Nocardia cyriacigeorgica]